MRSALIASATGALLLLLSTAAYADPPPGVGAAVVASGFECTVGVPVRPGEAFPILPGGYGIVLAPILGENTMSVTTNSANGNINLSCHGRIEFGSEITAIDYVTGLEVTATITEFDEGCDVIAPVLPDICRGGVAIQNAETVYHPILFPDGGTCEIVPGLVTSDYRTLLTRSGRAAVNCHYVEE
jgi:hypothetical protein